jgi:methionyl aminopeptidase
MTPLQASEIRLMEKSGQIAAACLYHTGSFVKAGITTNELDKIAYDFALSKGAKPAPLGYNGYPKSICTSINECVCHGLPDETKLKDGDIINIDVTTIYEGFHGDTSSMFYVGDVSDKAKALVDCAKDAMMKGIEQVGPKVKTGDIGFAVEKFVTRKGYYPVKEIGGHGIGRIFHDDPWIPSYGKKGKGPGLMPWICITVEPMVNETSAPFDEYDIPGSSIKYYLMSDKSLSAQFEHTVLVTDAGHQILTLY